MIANDASNRPHGADRQRGGGWNHIDLAASVLRQAAMSPVGASGVFFHSAGIVAVLPFVHR